MTVDAVIVGGDVNGLGILRSLRQGGVNTCLLTADANDIALRSRYGEKRIVSALEGTELVDALADIANASSRPPMLFLTEERGVRTVSAQRAKLLDRYCLRLPEHERLMALMHKQGFQELAESVGAPIPRTLRLRSSEDLRRCADIQFPCVLKPALKNYEYGRRFKKAYVVQGPMEVKDLFEQISPVLPDLVLQEWIDGEDSDIYFCLQYLGADGTLISSFTGRKVRSWPPRIGGTASCTSAWPDHDELTRETLVFFQRVGFSGMGSMEFKRDKRDGRFYMIEPTVARTDFQEEVATVHGVNIPLDAYRYEVGLTAGESSLTAERKLWRDPDCDRWSAQLGMTPTELDRLPRCDAYWRWDDPGPALWRWGNRLSAKLRHLSPNKWMRPGGSIKRK